MNALFLDNAYAYDLTLGSLAQIASMAFEVTSGTTQGFRAQFDGVDLNTVGFPTSGGTLVLDYYVPLTFGGTTLCGVTIGVASSYAVTIDVSQTQSPVPLPAALPLLTGGLLTLAAVRRKRRRGRG